MTLLKLGKKQWAQYLNFDARDGYAESDGFYYREDKHTAKDFVFANISTADVEVLAMQHDTAGMLIKGDFSRRFLLYHSSEWRG